MEVHLRFLLPNGCTPSVRCVFLAAVVITTGAASPWVKGPPEKSSPVRTVPCLATHSQGSRTATTFDAVPASVKSVTQERRWAFLRNRAHLHGPWRRTLAD